MKPFSLKNQCSHFCGLAAAMLALFVSIGPGYAASSEADGKQSEETGKQVTISAETIADPKVIATGMVVWKDQCRHCHGKSAYPGKAPKLKPRKYTADFVFDRVTNGFRKMPPWADVYSEEERIGVAAYILSKGFKP